MGFDKNDDRPVVHPRRWGTKVNFGIIGGVILFVVAGVLAMHWIDAHKDQVTNSVQQKTETEVKP